MRSPLAVHFQSSSSYAIIQWNGSKQQTNSIFIQFYIFVKAKAPNILLYGTQWCIYEKTSFLDSIWSKLLKTIYSFTSKALIQLELGCMSSGAHRRFYCLRSRTKQPLWINIMKINCDNIVIYCGLSKTKNKLWQPLVIFYSESITSFISAMVSISKARHFLCMQNVPDFSVTMIKEDSCLNIAESLGIRQHY